MKSRSCRSALSQLPGVPSAEARLNPGFVRFHPEIEPLVRLLEEAAQRIKRGLKYRELLRPCYWPASATFNRGRFLAAGVFNLRGSGVPDNELVKRTRTALGA